MNFCFKKIFLVLKLYIFCFVIGGVDFFMVRIDFVIVIIIFIVDWLVNNKIGGIKLYRLFKLERVCVMI